jgi:sugar transferase (PEP-CTERM/EpsH1 system associated)
MKLLFLAHRIPYPPNKGDKIRSYHALQALASRGHEVHLLAFADDLNDLNYQVDLARICASVEIVPLRRALAAARAAANLLSSRPLSLGYFASRKMRRLVERSMSQREFDAVFVYSSTMAQYAPRELASRTVVDLVDIDSEKWREYAGRANPLMSRLYSLEGKRLREYEYEIVKGFANTVVTTGREAALLDRLDEFTRRARLRVITNGVDLDYFQPVTQAPDTTSPRLVFVGAMDYYANVEGARYFAEEIFPLIRARESRAKFSIVGANPTAEVKKLTRHPGVTVTGAVPDVRPYLQDAAVCVVPLQIARGVQNKVLEAMAAGKAIIATPQSVAGLRVVPGEHLMVADTPEKFADTTLEVIRDESLRESLELRARYFVEAEHDWNPLHQKLVELIEAVGARAQKQGRPDSRAIANN